MFPTFLGMAVLGAAAVWYDLRPKIKAHMTGMSIAYIIVFAAAIALMVVVAMGVRPALLRGLYE